ncbi:MAG: DUF1415 domain-containing protein [Pseudomarimonas sp.]
MTSMHADNSSSDDDPAISATRAWIERVVVAMNLCPFAKRELMQNRVRFVTTGATDEEQLLHALHAELTLLDAQPEVETSVLIHPHVLQNFDGYNQFLNLADELLAEMDWEGVYQVASFHPYYQFGGTDEDDAENYSNRSPYPMLHLLREESVERAIVGYPDVAGIPVRNVARLRELGAEKLRQLLSECAPQ